MRLRAAREQASRPAAASPRTAAGLTRRQPLRCKRVDEQASLPAETKSRQPRRPAILCCPSRHRQAIAALKKIKKYDAEPRLLIRNPRLGTVFSFLSFRKSHLRVIPVSAAKAACGAVLSQRSLSAFDVTLHAPRCNLRQSSAWTKRPSALQPFATRYSPACAFKASALSVCSHGRSISVLPK